MNVNINILHNYIDILTDLFPKDLDLEYDFNYDIIKIFEQILKKLEKN